MTITFSPSTIKELMTPHPVLIKPSATLQEAAKKMEVLNCGSLPVGTEKNLKGIITDRDIVIRAIAQGKDPAHEKVADYMTPEIFACNENDTLEAAAEKMHQHKITRLVVKDREGKVTGILSFGNILRGDADPKELACCVKHAAGPVAI
jgi:CBS domain-containing protein